MAVNVVVVAENYRLQDTYENHLIVKLILVRRAVQSRDRVMPL